MASTRSCRTPRRSAPEPASLLAGVARLAMEPIVGIHDRHDGAMTDVLVIADTHLGAGRGERLLDRLGTELVTADIVLHAGDITDDSVLQALRAAVGVDSVHAVRG